MDKPLSDSSVSLKLALIQKRCEQLMSEDSQEIEALSLEDDTHKPDQAGSRDYFIDR